MKPPSLPIGSHSLSDRRRRMFVALAIVASTFVILPIVLRICGLLCPFNTPTGAMSPAVAPGDHIMMEGFTRLVRSPRHGDIVVFKTDGIPQLPPKTIYVKRIAGIPGDRLQISNGKLYINDQHVPLRNAAGEIVYLPPASGMANSLLTDLTVPSGRYFVLGDNSTNSSDSRYWGTVPAGNIKGHVWFCYWPPDRMGDVK